MSTREPAQNNRAVPFLLSYGLTVILVAAATGALCGLERAFGPIPPFLTFYPALMIAALFGGQKPLSMDKLLAKVREVIER